MISGISGTLISKFKFAFPFIMTSPASLIYPMDPQADGKYLEILFALKEPNLAFIVSTFMCNLSDMLDYMKDHWELLCEDIEKGTINPEIKASAELRKALEKNLKPDPKRAAILREEFEKGFEDPICPRIWPKLCFAASISGGTFSGYTENSRKYLGPNVLIDYLGIFSSENVMALTIQPEEDGYVLLPQTAFYEFVPVECDDYSQILQMHELEVGKKYELVITNLSGLYRYKIKDVIEVIDFYGEIPKVRFSHRKSQLLNMSGEKITETDLAAIIKVFSEKIQVPILDYAIYGDRDAHPPKYQVLIEPKTELDPKKIPEYEKILEECFKEVSLGYKLKQGGGNLGSLEILIQQRESHALYRDIKVLKGASSNQVKPVRVLDSPMKKKFFFGLLEK